jgi:hypothetical protein
MLFLYRFYFFLEKRSCPMESLYFHKKKDDIHVYGMRKKKERKFNVGSFFCYNVTHWISSCARYILWLWWDAVGEFVNRKFCVINIILKLISNLLFYGLITMFWRFLFSKTLNNCLRKSQINITKTLQTN